MTRDHRDPRHTGPGAERPLDLAAWTAHSAHRIRTLDPDAPLDDLEPLRALVGTARVVSLGENSHQVREFARLRHRMLRFLVEECSFTVHAQEFGLAEGRAVDSWVQGGPGDIDELLAPRPGERLGQPAEIRDTLRWQRRHNAAARCPVRFAGVDVPSAGGDLAPALEPVADYLADVDPGALRHLNAAMDVAGFVAGASVMVPALARQSMGDAAQDRLGAALGRLLNRFTVAREIYIERSDADRYESALWDLWGAWRTDQAQRAMTELVAGAPDLVELCTRERYLADSVLRLLDRDPGARVVLTAHNAHIQRAANAPEGPLSLTPMGALLARALGDDYVAVALTSTAGDTVENMPDTAHPNGFRWQRADTPPAVADSVEALFAEVPETVAMIDARAARDHAQRNGLAEPVRTRLDSMFIEVPAFSGFDAVVNVPRTTLSADLADPTD